MITSEPRGTDLLLLVQIHASAEAWPSASHDYAAE